MIHINSYFKSQGYTCKSDHVKQGNYDDDATVCHCYGNRCNIEVPELDQSTTTATTATTATTSMTTSTTANSKAPSLAINSALILVSFWIVRL